MINIKVDCLQDDCPGEVSMMQDNMEGVIIAMCPECGVKVRIEEMYE